MPIRWVAVAVALVAIQCASCNITNLREIPLRNESSVRLECYETNSDSQFFIYPDRTYLRSTTGFKLKLHYDHGFLTEVAIVDGQKWSMGIWDGDGTSPIPVHSKNNSSKSNSSGSEGWGYRVTGNFYIALQSVSGGAESVPADLRLVFIRTASATNATECESLVKAFADANPFRYSQNFLTCKVPAETKSAVSSKYAVVMGIVSAIGIFIAAVSFILGKKKPELKKKIAKGSFGLGIVLTFIRVVIVCIFVHVDIMSHNVSVCESDLTCPQLGEFKISRDNNDTPAMLKTNAVSAAILFVFYWVGDLLFSNIANHFYLMLDEAQNKCHVWVHRFSTVVRLGADVALGFAMVRLYPKARKDDGAVCTDLSYQALDDGIWYLLIIFAVAMTVPGGAVFSYFFVKNTRSEAKGEQTAENREKMVKATIVCRAFLMVVVLGFVVGSVVTGSHVMMPHFHWKLSVAFNVPVAFAVSLSSAVYQHFGRD